jgi:hypothetical protein
VSRIARPAGFGFTTRRRAAAQDAHPLGRTGLLRVQPHVYGADQVERSAIRMSFCWQPRFSIDPRVAWSSKTPHRHP